MEDKVLHFGSYQKKEKEIVNWAYYYFIYYMFCYLGKF